MLPIEAGLVVWMLSLVLVLVLIFFVVRFFFRLNRKVDRLAENQHDARSQD